MNEKGKKERPRKVDRNLSKTRNERGGRWNISFVRKANRERKKRKERNA
jgi:hypothetical protein